MRPFARRYAISLLTVCALILLAAAVHKSGIESKDYVHSPLIGVQLLGLCALFLTLPASVIMPIIVARQKKWKEFACLLVCIAFPILTFWAATLINAETLVYMT